MTIGNVGCPQRFEMIGMLERSSRDYSKARKSGALDGCIAPSDGL